MTGIRVINLEASVDRHRHMQSMLDGLALDYEIVPAVDGTRLSRSEIDHVYDERGALDFGDRKLSTAEIGCALSHMRIYEEIVENSHEAMLILEDDVFLDESVLPVLNPHHLFPSDWDIVFLAYDAHRASLYDITDSLEELAVQLKRSAGPKEIQMTAGYIVSLSSLSDWGYGSR